MGGTDHRHFGQKRQDRLRRQGPHRCEPLPRAHRMMAATHTLTASLALMLSAAAAPALADDGSPDKSDYTLFNPTPDADLRSFSTDRPPKANSPYTVDAGHLQYETDIAVFAYGETDGVKTQDWTVFDPTLKLGLTNTIDAELQITPYESVVTKSASNSMSVSGVGEYLRAPEDQRARRRSRCRRRGAPAHYQAADGAGAPWQWQGGRWRDSAHQLSAGGFTVIDYLQRLSRRIRLPGQYQPSARQALDLLYRALHHSGVSERGKADLHPGCSVDLRADGEFAARFRRQFQSKRRRAAGPALCGPISAVLICVGIEPRRTQ